MIIRQYPEHQNLSYRSFAIFVTLFKKQNFNLIKLKNILLNMNDAFKEKSTTEKLT